MIATLHCKECGALLYFRDTIHGKLPLDLDVWVEKHQEWHDGINARINEAAQVGAHADMMTTPLGSNSFFRADDVKDWS